MSLIGIIRKLIEFKGSLFVLALIVLLCPGSVTGRPVFVRPPARVMPDWMESGDARLQEGSFRYQGLVARL